MKKIIIILLVLSNSCFSQITNGDFENWRTITTIPLIEEPSGWTSNNLGIWKHYKTIPIEKSSDSYSGNFALKINQFYDSTSNCKNSYLAYKERIIDTSLYSNKCFGFGVSSPDDYDTLTYHPYKISFYYKTVNIKSNPFNLFEINLGDTARPLFSGIGLAQLTPSSTYIKKEILISNVISAPFQLISININIKNSFDSLYKDGYVLIDNIQFEGIQV